MWNKKFSVLLIHFIELLRSLLEHESQFLMRVLHNERELNLKIVKWFGNFWEYVENKNGLIGYILIDWHWFGYQNISKE